MQCTKCLEQIENSSNDFWSDAIIKPPGNPYNLRVHFTITEMFSPYLGDCNICEKCAYEVIDLALSRCENYNKIKAKIK